MTLTAQPTFLLMAIEMSNRVWKLGFEAAGRRRVVDIPARDLAALDQEIGEAKRKLRLAAAADVRSCYEAGRDGFWLHRALTARGIQNVVVDPSSIEVDRRARRRKTDTIDVKKLLKLLARHAAGELDVWSVARVPSVEDEDCRRDTRERERLLKERTQHSNRLRSLLVLHGVDLQITADFARELDELRLWDGSTISDRLKQELLREHARWKLVHDQVKELEAARRAALKENQAQEDPDAHDARLAKVNRLRTLRGVGDECSWKLVHEYFWRDFQNRREVGACAGLTGTPFDSGSSEREQGISKAGNRRIRSLMVELAWLWVRYQPQSELARWFERRFARGSRRMRKVGIVAVARRLLIDLWRYLEQGVVPAGAVANPGAEIG